MLGAPQGMHLMESLRSSSAWEWNSIVVGVATVSAVLLAPKVTKAVPATIIGLLAGVAAYFTLAVADRTLLTLAGNAAVVGPLGGGDGSAGGGVFAAITGRFAAAGGIGATQLDELAVPALTLAVLLSIDTLKTCVVIDAMTRTRHDSNQIGRASCRERV